MCAHWDATKRWEERLGSSTDDIIHYRIIWYQSIPHSTLFNSSSLYLISMHPPQKLSKRNHIVSTTGDRRPWEGLSWPIHSTSKLLVPSLQHLTDDLYPFFRRRVERWSLWNRRWLRRRHLMWSGSSRSWNPIGSRWMSSERCEPFSQGPQGSDGAIRLLNAPDHTKFTFGDEWHFERLIWARQPQTLNFFSWLPLIDGWVNQPNASSKVV